MLVALLVLASFGYLHFGAAISALEFKWFPVGVFIPEEDSLFREEGGIVKAESDLLARGVTPSKTIPLAAEPRNVPAISSVRSLTQSVVSDQSTQFKQSAGKFPFYVAEKRWNASKRAYDFYREGRHGAEIVLRRDVRSYFISENQNDYPGAESGCGPTALLNLYIWYTKFGLLKESIRHSNERRYKQLKFSQIDQKILGIQREARSARRGTNTLEQVVALDEIVQENSPKVLRMHFKVKQPPLMIKDFLQLTRNYWAGILSVQPKDPMTGRMMDNHAVLVIRSDTRGMISVANWGTFSHGILVQRDDGQWFIPDDPSQYELRINCLTILVPSAHGLNCLESSVAPQSHVTALDELASDFGGRCFFSAKCFADDHCNQA